MDALYAELVIDEDDDFDFESPELQNIQAVANKALGRNLNNDEEPQTFEQFEMDEVNVDQNDEINENDLKNEEDDFEDLQINDDSLSPIKGNPQLTLNFESIKEEIEAENKSDSVNSEQDMSFDGVQSTMNFRTRKLSEQVDDVPGHHSTVEIKNELGCSEISEDQKSYAMSLELLTSQIEQKKQQLENEPPVDIQGRSRSNSGSDCHDNNPIVCFSAEESDEMELSDSQKSNIQKQKSLGEEDDEIDVQCAYRMLESDGNIYNFTLSGISVNSYISKINEQDQEEVILAPKRGTYKSKLDRISIAKKLNQSVDTANENEEHKEPFQSKLLKQRVNRNTKSQQAFRF